MKVLDLLAHPLLQLLWLCLDLPAIWIGLAIDPYLWAYVTLGSLYIALPLLLLTALNLFVTRRDPQRRRRALQALGLASLTAGHAALHLVWVTRFDWRF